MPVMIAASTWTQAPHDHRVARRADEAAVPPYNSGLSEMYQAMPFDLEFWKQSEGQIVDSVFPLERCVRGGSRGAVFETQFEGRPAAIKLVPGTPESIDALLKLWEKAASLSHPALVRIFARGETALGDVRCAYIVMERTDDNLADLLAERPLTPAETREMLPPLFGALKYLHENGFTHGGLKPANIMAIGDQLKISSDGLVPGGDPASDCRAIGTLLEEVLGANRNAHLPEPFAEIARHCSASDPAARWDLAQIEARVRGESEPVTQPQSRAAWWALAAAGAVIGGAVALWPSRSSAPSQSTEVVAPRADAVPESTIPESKKPSAFKPPSGAQSSSTPDAITPDGLTPVGVTKVLPNIPESARKTITGRIRVNVRVRVDRAGNVDNASLERPRASRYLSGRVLAAAKAWKFPPGDAPQDWMLRFELTRQQTLASASKIGN